MSASPNGRMDRTESPSLRPGGNLSKRPGSRHPGGDNHRPSLDGSTAPMIHSRLLLAAAALCVVGGTLAFMHTRMSRRSRSHLMVTGNLHIAASRPTINSSDIESSSRMDRLMIEQSWPSWITAPGPDPFAEIAVAPKARDAITPEATNPVVVSAIWTQPGHTLAVVNGRIVREGADLPPFKVRNIRPDHVDLCETNGVITKRVSIHVPSAPCGSATSTTRLPAPANRASKPSGG